MSSVSLQSSIIYTPYPLRVVWGAGVDPSWYELRGVVRGGLAIWHTGHRPGGPLTQCGPVWSAMLFFFFSSSSLNSLRLGRPIGYRVLAVCCQYRHILLVYCLSLSINLGLTGSESPDSDVNHNTNQGGAGPHGIGGGSRGTGCCWDRNLKWIIRVKNARVALRSIGKKSWSLWRWRLLNVPNWRTYLVPGSPAQQQQVRRETSEEDSTMMSEWRQTW